MRLLTGQAIADEGELGCSGPSCPRSRRRRAPRWASSRSSTTSTSTSRSRTTCRLRPPLPGHAARRGAAVERALEMAPPRDRRDTRVDKLSGGMRRRLLLARGLVHEPRLVLLDEPTVGLDPQIRPELWALIDALRSEGTTILMSTHYIEEAQRLADKVLVMSHGKVVAAGPPAELVAEHAGQRGARGLRPAGAARRGRGARRASAGCARGAPARASRSSASTATAPAARRRPPAGEPRGRLRPADRRGDRLMASRRRAERRAAPPRTGGARRRDVPRGRQLLVVLALGDVLVDRRADDLPARVRLRASARWSARSTATPTSSSSAPAWSRPR